MAVGFFGPEGISESLRALGGRSEKAASEFFDCVANQQDTANATGDVRDLIE